MKQRYVQKRNATRGTLFQNDIIDLEQGYLEGHILSWWIRSRRDSSHLSESFADLTPLAL